VEHRHEAPAPPRDRAGENETRLPRRAGVCFALAVTAVASILPAAARAAQDMGRPACDYCKMIITEPRFGGRLETQDRKVYIFDSTECLAAFCLRPPQGRLEIRAIWSVRWDRPQAVVDARKAWYLLSDRLPSPMEVNLSAFGTSAAAATARKTHPGAVLRWAQVLELVHQRWFQPHE